MKEDGVLIVSPLECSDQEIISYLRTHGVISQDTPHFLKKAGGTMQLVRFGKGERDRFLDLIQAYLTKGITRVILVNRVACEYYNNCVPNHGNGTYDHVFDLDMAARIIGAVLPMGVMTFVAIVAGSDDTILAMENSNDLRP